MNVHSLTTREKTTFDAHRLFEAYIEYFHKHFNDEIDKARHYKAFLKTLDDLIEFATIGDYPQLFEVNEFADSIPGEPVESEEQRAFEGKFSEIRPFYFTAVEENAGNLQYARDVERKWRSILKTYIKKLQDYGNQQPLLRQPTLGEMKKSDLDLKRAPELFEKYVNDFNKHYNSKLQKAQHFKAFLQTLKDTLQMMKDADDDEGIYLNQSADNLHAETSSNGDDGWKRSK